MAAVPSLMIAEIAAIGTQAMPSFFFFFFFNPILADITESVVLKESKPFPARHPSK